MGNGREQGRVILCNSVGRAVGYYHPGDDPVVVRLRSGRVLGLLRPNTSDVYRADGIYAATIWRGDTTGVIHEPVLGVRRQRPVPWTTADGLPTVEGRGLAAGELIPPGPRQVAVDLPDWLGEFPESDE